MHLTYRPLTVVYLDEHGSETGLVKPGDKHHAVKAHSFRRFFKTNLVAAGVAESRADYFLGHVSDTYNQVRDLGVEKLRESYARGQLSIRPQARQNLTKTPISLIQAAGKDPSKYLTGAALSEPHRVTAISETVDQRDVRILLSELVEYIRETSPVWHILNTPRFAIRMWWARPDSPR